jgi:DNA-binding XRE family transcriptional regulator
MTKKYRKWSEIKRKGLSPEEIERVDRDVKAELRAMTLRELREDAGRTQAEIADLADTTQAALSRVERREDNPIATLRRYVEALGGELELVAVIGNKRIKLLGV